MLDYLKIDVEGYEWFVIDYLFKNGIIFRIRYFFLEYYIFLDWLDKVRYLDLFRIYKRLKEVGFYKYFIGIYLLNYIFKKFNI